MKRSKLKITPLLTNVLLVSAKRSRDVANAMLRFQELYESPLKRFRTQAFTRAEFREWYKTKNDGRFTYLSDWTGFNVPKYVFGLFRDLGFQNLTADEKRILDAADLLPPMSVVIGMAEGDMSALEHELAHAFYSFNWSYRSKVNAILSDIPDRTLDKLLSELRIVGYGKHVLLDEAQAYILFEDKWFAKRELDITKFAVARELMKRVYRDCAVAYGLLPKKKEVSA